MSKYFMAYNTRGRPIRREEFHENLREWFEGAEPGDTIGDTSEHNQKPWVWIRDLGHWYHLNADSRYEGIRDYLAMLDAHGGMLKWGVVPNETTGRENKAVFGPNGKPVKGMYLYRDLR